MSIQTESPSHLTLGESSSYLRSSDPAQDTFETIERTLIISSHNWKGHVRIFEANSTTLLYKVKWSIRKPLRLTMHSASHDHDLGSITFHALTWRIDIVVHGLSIAMKPQGLLFRRFSYVSPSFDNTTLTWLYEGHLRTFDLTCLNNDNMPVARVSINPWGVQKLGTMKICSERAASGLAMDELVATGFAVMECWLILNASTLGSFGVIAAAV